MSVMRAKRPNLVTMRMEQFPNPDPVSFGHFEPRRCEQLHNPAAGMAVWLNWICLAVVAVRVPTMQQPSIIFSQGYSTMPTRMSGERDQDKLGLSNLNRRRAVQPKPLIALNAMRLPPGVMSAMLRKIRPPLHRRSRVKTSFQLVGEKMDCRRRKIGQATRVIQVQVRQKDMFHLCRVVTMCFHLPDRCLVQIPGTTDKTGELPNGWRGSGAIAYSPTGINQR
jgi:hypothetical protein